MSSKPIVIYAGAVLAAAGPVILDYPERDCLPRIQLCPRSYITSSARPTSRRRSTRRPPISAPPIAAYTGSVSASTGSLLLGAPLAVDDRAVLTQYTISSKDVAGPFLQNLPSRMEDMKDLARPSYTSPRQELAEKFHMSEKLLSALNPDRHFDRAGIAIVVVDIADATP
jgi:hypothetical protein